MHASQDVGNVHIYPCVQRIKRSPSLNSTGPDVFLPFISAFSCHQYKLQIFQVPTLATTGAECSGDAGKVVTHGELFALPSRLATFVRGTG